MSIEQINTTYNIQIANSKLIRLSVIVYVCVFTCRLVRLLKSALEMDAGSEKKKKYKLCVKITYAHHSYSKVNT